MDKKKKALLLGSINSVTWVIVCSEFIKSFENQSDRSLPWVMGASLATISFVVFMYVVEYRGCK